MGILNGSREIAIYARTERRTLSTWIKTLNFPARKIGNAPNAPLRSHSDLVDKWLKNQIENPVNSSN